MPKLLDLFCGAGGAAMGYHRAGFEVVGVDSSPQKNFPFEFHQADALDFDLSGFDAIHASPPCQRYSVANNIHGNEHPDLLGITRDLLIASGLPWIIENVPGAPMPDAVTVCGRAFPTLNVKRHRLFESNLPIVGTGPCPKGHPGDWLLVFGHTVLERGTTIGRTPNGGPRIRRKHTTTERGRAAMGIDWMNRDELSQAIPPPYTEFVGSQILRKFHT